MAQQNMLDNVITIAKLIVTTGTPRELLDFLTALDEDTFVALFVATLTADDLVANLEPEDLDKMQQLAADIGTLH